MKPETNRGTSIGGSLQHIPVEPLGCQAGPAVPEEIGVEPKEGQLAPHEEPEGSIRAFGPLGRCVSNKTCPLLVWLSVGWPVRT